MSTRECCQSKKSSHTRMRIVVRFGIGKCSIDADCSTGDSDLLDAVRTSNGEYN